MERVEPRVRVLWIGAPGETRPPLGSLLATPGVEGMRVAGVREALALSSHEDFALLVLDVPAAGEDEGLGPTRTLRDGWRERSTPLLLLMERPTAERVRAAHALGAADCLERDPDPDVLRAKVSVFVSLHQRLQATRLAREATWEREMPLRLALEAGGLGHWRLELATLRLDASSGCKRNFGLPPEGDLSSYDALRALIHPEDRPLMAQSVELALASRGDYASDYRVVPPEGPVRWVAARGRVVCDVTGAPTSMVGITLDITERMRGAQKLAFLSEASRLLNESLEPEDVLRRVARLASSSIATFCLVDLLEEDGALRRVAMAHREPSLDERLHQLWGPLPGSRASRLAAETLRQGWTTLYSEFSAEQRARAAVSPEHLRIIEEMDPRSVILMPMRSGGRPWGTITLARGAGESPFDEQDVDLAEELARRAVVALENARLLRATRAAVQLRDEFLSVASHELKTPLTSLNLRLQALVRSAETAGSEVVMRRLPQEVEAMRLQVKRLSGLMNALLDVSRLEGEPLTLELEPLDLAVLVREGVARAAPEAARARCQVELTCADAIAGQWDRARIEQVLAQLLANALKYGAGRPVHITADAREGEAWFTVRDEGIGIEPDALPRLFDKFERAVSVRNYGGLGLGLYLVRRILQSHGGSIQVDSSPGRGATFTARLPQAPSGVGTSEQARGRVASS